jgi:hypothetical protein
MRRYEDTKRGSREREVMEGRTTKVHIERFVERTQNKKKSNTVSKEDHKNLTVKPYKPSKKKTGQQENEDDQEQKV